jgi:hypothetical protein
MEEALRRHFDIRYPTDFFLRRRASMQTKIILLFSAIVGICGCSEPAVDGVDAWGNVTWGGKPIASGMVTFTPDGGKGNSGHQGWAAITDGRFDTRDSKGKKVSKGPCIVLVTSKQPSTNPAHPKGTNLVLRHEQPVEIPMDSAELNLDVPNSHQAIVALPDGKEE